MNRLKTCFLLLAVLFGMSVTACSDDDSVGTPKVTIPEKMLTDGMTFSKEGGIQTLSILSNIALDVKSDSEWCLVTLRGTTANGTSTYEVEVAPNSGSEERKATISIVGEGVNEKVQVVQIVELSILSTSALTGISSAGGQVTVRLAAAGEVKVAVDVAWITEKTAASRATRIEQEREFTVLTNRGDARTGHISFTVGTVTETLTVEQNAGEAHVVGGSDAMAVAKSLGLGWNLGNQLDAHSNGVADETSWGNPAATQATFDALAEAGFATIRIPVTWLGHIGDAPGYQIDEAWLNRVAEVVGYAEQAGLNAIINIHHDGADSAYWLDIKDAATDESVNQQVKAQLAAMWTQIAEKFKDKGNFLVFESMNEIHDGGWGWGANLKDGGKQYATLNEWNQVFVDAVRDTGGKNTDRYLGIPSYCTNPEYALEDSFVLPDDPTSGRLMVSVHYYAPTDYTLNADYSEWGHTAAPGKASPYGGDEEYMKDIFSKLNQKFVKQGVPVYLGEMGCVHRSDERAESFRKYYLEYLCKAAATWGLVPVYWDNGSAGAGKECSGLLNHGNGRFLNNGEEIVEAMKRGVYDEDASYTLQTVYENAPE